MPGSCDTLTSVLIFVLFIAIQKMLSIFKMKEPAWFMVIVNFDKYFQICLGKTCCMMSPDQSVETEDEEDGFECRICQHKKRKLQTVSNISVDLVAKIEDSTG